MTIAMIHKFSRLVDEAYSSREDIIVISDEAHRTQYGRLALNMRKAIPRAKFLGFTGTPLIDTAEKQLTREVFGEYVSIYDFQRAVADGATLPLFYENRGEKLRIVDEEVNQRIIDRIEAAKAAGELDAEQEEKLYRELAQDYPILTSPTRLEKVADDFVKHYHQRCSGFDKKSLILRGVNAVCEPDERRKTFEVMANDISARFKGLFPNPGLFAYDKQDNAISAIYNRLQERRTPRMSARCFRRSMRWWIWQCPPIHRWSKSALCATN